mgnify:CR=1 FL=1
MDIMAELNKIVDDYKGEHIALTDEPLFEELGFDSLDKVDIMMQIEEKFGIQFPDDLVITTAGELKKVIAELAA